MSLAKIKKGSKVILKSFTGTPMGLYEVSSSDEKKIIITKKNGDEGIFSRKTGKQINVAEGKERYASSLIEDDGSTPSMRPSDGKNKTTTKKLAKTKKLSQPDPETENEDENLEPEIEEEEAPAEKPIKKTSKRAITKTEKSVSKKKTPTPDIESENDEDDEDEYEEVE